MQGNVWHKMRIITSIARVTLEIWLRGKANAGGPYRDDMHCNDMRARVHTDFATTPGRPFEQAILPHMMAATICADGIYFRRRNHLRWKQRICNVCCLRCRTQVLQIPLKLGAYRLSFLEPSDRARKASKVPTLH